MVNAVSIDGNLGREEWPERPAVEIQNGDNTYRIFTGWNKQNLFLAAAVKDRYVFSRLKDSLFSDSGQDTLSETELISKIYQKYYADDGVCFFFDVDASRSSQVEPADKLLYVTPSGRFLSITLDGKTQEKKTWGKNIECKARILKPPDNMPDSAFAGYRFEVAVPWKDLVISPASG